MKTTVRDGKPACWAGTSMRILEELNHNAWPGIRWMVVDGWSCVFGRVRPPGQQRAAPYPG